MMTDEQEGDTHTHIHSVFILLSDRMLCDLVPSKRGVFSHFRNQVSWLAIAGDA